MAQENWRWCYDCQGLYDASAPQPPDRCVSSRGHQRLGSGNYVLDSNPPGQRAWRRCRKCVRLWFAGSPSRGACHADPAGHEAEDRDYALPSETDGVIGQGGWRWCRKCYSLYFAFDPVPGRPTCAAGDEHDPTGSSAYVVPHIAPELIWLDSGFGVHALREGVSQWFDRRTPTGVAAGAPEFPFAATTHTRIWPRLEHGAGRPALRFGDDLGGPRKALPIRQGHTGRAGANLELWETAYTAIVVVQRTSSRGDNYPLASGGLNCGLFGCQDNSSLHLGWQGDRRVRFGQYGNDVDLPDVPPFDPNRPVVSIISAVSDTSTKLVALDEPQFSCVSLPRLDGRLLRAGDRIVAVGGLPALPSGIPPGYHFNGFVFELILYIGRLPNHELNMKRQLLREKYGMTQDPFDPFR